MEVTVLKMPVTPFKTDMVQGNCAQNADISFEAVLAMLANMQQGAKTVNESLLQGGVEQKVKAEILPEECSDEEEFCPQSNISILPGQYYICDINALSTPEIKQEAVAIDNDAQADGDNSIDLGEFWSDKPKVIAVSNSLAEYQDAFSKSGIKVQEYSEKNEMYIEKLTAEVESNAIKTEFKAAQREKMSVLQTEKQTMKIKKPTEKGFDLSQTEFETQNNKQLQNAIKFRTTQGNTAKTNDETAQTLIKPVRLQAKAEKRADANIENDDAFRLHLNNNPSAIQSERVFEQTESSNVKEISRQVTQGVKSAVQSGKSEVIIELVPEGLGRLTVKLTKTDGKIGLSITATNPNTSALLEASVAQLKTALTAQQVEVSGIIMNAQHNSGTFNAQSSFNAFANFTGGQRHSPFSAHTQQAFENESGFEQGRILRQYFGVLNYTV